MKERVKYKDIMRFAWHYWQKRVPMGIILVALMIVATIVDAFVPIYTGRIVDAMIAADPNNPEDLSEALNYLWIFMGLAASFQILRWISISMWAKFAVHCLYEILTDAMQKVQRFSSDWHANTFAGGTVRKITRGMWSFDVFGDTLFMGLMPAIIIMIGMTAMLLIEIPWVGLFALTMIIIYCAISIWMALRILAPHFEASAKADTKIGAVLADIITGNQTVKSFAAERREDRTFNRVAVHWRLLAQRAWLTAEMSNLIRGALRMLMMSGMVGITIWLWRYGQATPGDIALSITSFFIVGGYLRDIGMHISNLQKSASEMNDVVLFWLDTEDVRDVQGAQPLKISDQADIVFDRVRFAYKGKTEPLFDELNITIKAGEKVALVGYSGSGKSTFVKLVQRLYDVNGGEIRIGGQNIAHVTQESLRQNIALVPQEPVLFHRSLLANIAYGKPNATMQEIMEASELAYAHEFIATLPDGYNTVVGERGIKLSGGERQRVAIARAILANAPILILDEATSSLDSISEHYIQKALQHLVKGRTTITIAHRLSTIKTADRILVFENGKVIEQGTHEELLKSQKSRYKDLYDMQSFGHI
jgi:ATP-binding cassette subfamily B protein